MVTSIEINTLDHSSKAVYTGLKPIPTAAHATSSCSLLRSTFQRSTHSFFPTLPSTIQTNYTHTYHHSYSYSSELYHISAGVIYSNKTNQSISINQPTTQNSLSPMSDGATGQALSSSATLASKSTPPTIPNSTLCSSASSQLAQ